VITRSSNTTTTPFKPPFSSQVGVSKRIHKKQKPTKSRRVGDGHPRLFSSPRRDLLSPSKGGFPGGLA